VNYPQTRKSQNRKLVKILADALDAHVAALAEEAVSRSLSEQGDAGQQQSDTASDLDLNHLPRKTIVRS